MLGQPSEILHATTRQQIKRFNCVGNLNGWLTDASTGVTWNLRHSRLKIAHPFVMFRIASFVSGFSDTDPGGPVKSC